MRSGKTVAYYNTAGASSGLQAGAQKYSYAMFFITEDALRQLDKADGFEIGVGPSIVLVDRGVAKTYTTMTLDKDIYAVVFDQKGLMAGMGIQGNRSRRSLHPDSVAPLHGLPSKRSSAPPPCTT
jgi:lipid-binding SYLF domain-containing protein